MNTTLALGIKQRVLAEPKLVNMNYFCETVKTHGHCNTVGCIAGHTLFASGMSLKTMRELELDNYEDIARTLLQISRAEARQLFYFYNDDRKIIQDGLKEEDLPYLQFAKRLRKQRPGSQRYAKIVADAIDHCIYRAENYLQLRDEK